MMNVRFMDAVEAAIADYNFAKSREIAGRRNTEHRGPHKPRCPECRLTIRGPNHAEGWDHLHRVKVKA